MARDVELNVVGHDKTSAALRSAAREVDRLKRKVNDLGDGTDKNNRSMEKFKKVAKEAALSVGKFTARLSSFASVAPLAVTGVIALGKATVAAAKGLGALAPALSILPGLAAGGGLIAATWKLAGSTFVSATKPVQDAVLGIQSKIGRLATGELPALSKQFVAVNFPFIQRAMERIATATGTVVTQVGKWVNSAAGQKVVSTISNATATAFERMAPHISDAVIALGNLVGRAGDKGFTGLADTVNRIADAVKRWADNTSSADIQGSLDKIKNAASTVYGWFQKIQAAVAWWDANQKAIKRVQDALAVLAIGIAVVVAIAGGPILWVTALVAGMGLAIRHFDQLKAAWTAVVNFISTNTTIQQYVTVVTGYIQALKNGFMKLWGPIVAVWSSAFASIKAMWTEWQPIVSFVLTVLGPVFKVLGAIIGAVFGAVVVVIGGAVSFIARALQVVAIIIKTFASATVGAFGIVRGAASAVGSFFASVFRGIGSVVSGAGRVVSSAIRGMGSVLNGIKSVVSGIGGAFRSAFGAVSSAASSAAGAVRSAVSTISGLVSRAKSLVSSIPGAGLLGFSGAAGSGSFNFAGAGASFTSAGGDTSPAYTIEDNTSITVMLDGQEIMAKVVKAVDKRVAQAGSRAKMGMAV